MTDASNVAIRPLEGLAEREACVALQERIWGAGFADRVPASILMIAQETGGVASGAFLGDRLVGFVFGITGVRDGRRVHWSDMLAVEADVRGRGIGHRLKVHQRELLLGRGVEVVRWTFDPLEARNAHLNLRRLGAVVREYRRDLYGHSSSPLHAGIGTDRLVAEWPIASARVASRVEDNVVGTGPALDATAPTVRIAIPSDIQALKRADLAAARAWRESVRTAFEDALGKGYTATDVDRGSGEDDVVHYILVQNFSL